jgi:hypothetical protein
MAPARCRSNTVRNDAAVLRLGSWDGVAFDDRWRGSTPQRSPGPTGLSFHTIDRHSYYLPCLPPEETAAAIRWIADNDERRGNPPRIRMRAPSALGRLIIWFCAIVK